MSLTNASHKDELRIAGWHSRGYLPHFDGREIPQFITLHLADSMPKPVIARWQKELTKTKCKEAEILLQKRIERYLDQGYGNAFLRDKRYFDRYIRDEKHFRNSVKYIENNPVKARLCFQT